MFYFFLPALKILSKTLRSFNTALRIVSNTTARHLLILLLTSAIELSYYNGSKLITIIVSLITSTVIVLEIIVSALQDYIFSALLLYYTHVNE
jgi:F0F1-type ATP synthase membrane subunit a